jgi:hypothetical protein
MYASALVTMADTFAVAATLNASIVRQNFVVFTTMGGWGAL